MSQVHKKKYLDYVSENWMHSSDRKMADALNLSHYHVQKLRCFLGLKRADLHPKTEDRKIAIILEMFSNGSSVTSIAKFVMLDFHKVNRIIDNNFFTKQRSYNTMTLVLQSKINFE